MRKSTYLLLLFLAVWATRSFGQTNSVADSLCRVCNLATSDTARASALNKLANYYYQNQYIEKADSASGRQIQIAEFLMDNNLILKAYFDNSAANIVRWSSSKDFDRVINLIQGGIDHAKKINDNNYTAIGYARLSSVLTKRGNYNDASKAIVSALAIQDISDSVKAIVYIEAGNYNLAKKEFTTASSYYNNAFDIATKNKNYYLEADVYRCLANLNDKLIGEENKAKEFLFKSLAVDRKYKIGEGLVKDYAELAKHEAEDDYINRAILIADSFHLESAALGAKEILLAIYMNRAVYDKTYTSEKMIAYLNSQPDLKHFFMRGAGENYDYELGEIYLYGDKPDSALYHFGKVTDYMLKNYDINNVSNIYLDIGDCYDKKGDIAKAKEYYLKALSNFQQSQDAYSIASTSEGLSYFYKTEGNYKEAFFYKELSTGIYDSLTKLTKTGEVVMLNEEREKKQKAEELRQQEMATLKNRNLQYMIITVAICVVFAGILVMGMFPVSRFAIRLLGYFFFISLFEFIVLVLDNNILHTITHGEPLKLWLIKIGLIGLLVPLQHFLEHRITQFLESRKLLKARMKFSWKNLWPKTKRHHKRAKNNAEEIEEDTAVL